MNKEPPQLGMLITGNKPRDAIHIAVAPVIANESLSPGDRIGFVGDAFTVGKGATTIGVVDPFLINDVCKGDKFYMFLLPNTITSLRHDWTHPAFVEEEAINEMAPMIDILRGHPTAREWIENYASQIGSDYHEIMEAADDYQNHGNYLTKGGTFEGEHIPAEFWEKYNTIRGIVVDDEGNFLSCSC